MEVMTYDYGRRNGYRVKGRCQKDSKTHNSGALSRHEQLSETHGRRSTTQPLCNSHMTRQHSREMRKPHPDGRPFCAPPPLAVDRFPSLRRACTTVSSSSNKEIKASLISVVLIWDK